MPVPSQNFIHVRNLVISDPKAPGIIKFSQATDVLRKETGYHICPLGADVAAAAHIPFPAHRHSVVAAHGPVAAIKRTLSHDQL